MTELVSGSIPMQRLVDNIDQYKSSPGLLMDSMMALLDEVSGGTINIVDATNPTVLLIEMAAVQTAAAINENYINLRRAYAKLALTESDLYRHLSDEEYIGRFATPGEVTFTFIMPLSEVLNNLVYDDDEGCYKAIIPRDSEYMVDGYTFTQEYPIVIRRYSNGAVQISYDSEIASPISALTGIVIKYEGRTDVNGVKWLSFDVPLKQMKISSAQYAVQQTSIFKASPTFTDQFVYARVYNKSTATGNVWAPLQTTHSDQVFDPLTPTAILKVVDQTLTVTIPYIYISNQQVQGSLRVDIYTSKGNVRVNLSNYLLTNFTLSLRALDTARDLNAFTEAWANLNLIAYSAGVLDGGTDGVDFDTLRTRVIYNTTGPQQVPITNISLESEIAKSGFGLVTNIDALTNRVFLATQKLPVPTDPGIYTSSNIGIVTYVADIATLIGLSSVRYTNARLTLLSNNLFSVVNGITTLVTPSEIDELMSLRRSKLISTVNDAQYVYSPYYYVLDLSQNIPYSRVYDLDRPIASNLNFVRQNQTLQLAVNTDSYSLTKQSYGYRLLITTRSGSLYKQEPDTSVSVQLALESYQDKETESALAYITGTFLGKTGDDERIFEFQIQTNYDLDTNNRIYITNASQSVGTAGVYVSISTTLNLFHTTNSPSVNFVPDETNALIATWLLSNGSVGNSHETLNVVLGSFLSNLWTRARQMVQGEVYQTYQNDMPAYYTQDVYQVDPVTNSILSFVDGVPTYTKLHSVGDAVLDDNGDPVYVARAGDVVKDIDGNPIVISPMSSVFELDLTVVDGRMFFVTDPTYTAYRDEIPATITSWIINDLEQITDRLLEKTRIFFYPLSTIGHTTLLLPDNTTAYIDSEQSPTVELSVEDSVKRDITIQTSIRKTVIQIIDSVFARSKFTVYEIESMIATTLGGQIKGVTVTGIGGQSNYRSINIAQGSDKLCVRKKLIALTDGSISCSEDVTVLFNRY